MTPFRAVATAAFVFGAFVGALVSTADAHNWGAGDWQNATAEEKRLCDENLNTSECTPEGSFNYFYISTVFPFNSSAGARLEDEFRNAVTIDYDPIYGVGGAVVENNTSIVDVLVEERVVNSEWDFAYTTCATNATTGYDNIRYYMWCDPQKLVVQDLTKHYNACWSSVSCTKHYMCHEVGHTYGLQHYVPKNSHIGSCMSYLDDADPWPNDEDIDHLQDCFNRPALPLAPWPADVRTVLCKYSD